MRQDFPYEDRNDLPIEEALQPLAVNLPPNPEGERHFLEVYTISLPQGRWTFGVRWSDATAYQHRYNTWDSMSEALAAGKKHLTRAIEDATVSLNESKNESV